MLRGLLVGMLGGGLVMAVLLMALSLLAPLPRVAAPVADEPGRAVPQASTPQRAALPERPSNIVERPAAPSGAAPVQTARPTPSENTTGQTVLLDLPRPADSTRPSLPFTPAAPAPEPSQAVPSGAAQTATRPPAPAAAAPAARDGMVASVPPSSTAAREAAPARRITGDATDVTSAPRAAFEPAGQATRNSATPMVIASVTPTSLPERPGRPRSELRISELLTDSGPIPPETMLVRGPNAPPAGQAPSAPAQLDPFATSPLGASDFAASLAGSRRLEGSVPLPEPQPTTPPERVAAAPQPAPQVPSQSRDAPMIGSPVLPLTERTGVRPLTERAPTPPLPSASAPPVPETIPGVPAWRQFSVTSERPTGPVLAVMLIDSGIPQRDRRLFINRGLPVTVVIDLEQLSAPRAIEEYRAAGFEVILLPGEDITAQEALTSYPGSVGLLMSSLSPRRVAAVEAAGHGVVLRPGGLDGGLRDFQQSGLPGLRIYRDIDAGRERAPVIARYLSRAGFEAARSNGEVILGRIRPDTLDALADYMTSDAGRSAPLAPVSALMALEVARLSGEG